jgi:hypothetical protein
MSFDTLYSCLIDATWLFLGSWIVLLTAAYIVAFNSDWSENAGKSTK